MHASASAAHGAAAAPPAPAADLVAWVESSGGSAAGVAVRRNEAGFGLAASRDCGAGSTLVSLPQRCHLTYDDSSDPRLLALIGQVPAELWGAKLALQASTAVPVASPCAPRSSGAPPPSPLPHIRACLPQLGHCTVACLLGVHSAREQCATLCRAVPLPSITCATSPAASPLLQVVAHRLQGATSPFAPYISNLLLGVAGLPMFFGGDALAALQYPPVTEQVKRRCRWLLAFAQRELAAARRGGGDPFGGADVDANALGWALAVVTSRAFRTRGPDQVGWQGWRGLGAAAAQSMQRRLVTGLLARSLPPVPTPAAQRMHSWLLSGHPWPARSQPPLFTTIQVLPCCRHLNATLARAPPRSLRPCCRSSTWPTTASRQPTPRSRPALAAACAW